MTLTNRPGDTGDSTDPSGARRSRPRLDRTPRSDVDPRHEDGRGPVKPRSRPASNTKAIVTNGDVMAADASFAARLDAVTDRVEPAPVAEKVDLAALVTSALPVVEREAKARPTPKITPADPSPTPEPALEPSVDPVPADPAIAIGEAATSAVARTAATIAAAPLPSDPVRGAGSQPAKKSKAIVGRRSRPRVRRVRRVVRSVDTWTVFKVSTLFYLVAYAIVLVAGVLLWNLAYATGTIENLQEFFTDFGWETFEFEGGKIFHSAWIVGLFLVIAGVGMNVTLATVFNLISDLVGGIGVTVLEEEVRVVPQASPEVE